MFASGGHRGQVLVIGVPMRLLRVIAVFTPEPWQGWGYGVGNKILKEGFRDGKGKWESAAGWSDGLSFGACPNGPERGSRTGSRRPPPRATRPACAIRGGLRSPRSLRIRLYKKVEKV